MITEKKYYRVPEFDGKMNVVSQAIAGVWVTQLNIEDIQKMKFETAIKYSKCISGMLIDESIQKCCIFVYFDEVNYDKEEYVKITWDELISCCEPVEMIVCN